MSLSLAAESSHVAGTTTVKFVISEATQANPRRSKKCQLGRSTELWSAFTAGSALGRWWPHSGDTHQSENLDRVTLSV